MKNLLLLFWDDINGCWRDIKKYVVVFINMIKEWVDYLDWVVEWYVDGVILVWCVNSIICKLIRVNNIFRVIVFKVCYGRGIFEVDIKVFVCGENFFVLFNIVVEVVG